MWSIRYLREKFKLMLADDAFYVMLVIILVGLGAFFFGRLSVMSSVGQICKPINSISLCPTIVGVDTRAIASSSLPSPADSASKLSSVTKPNATASYVASKSGTKYHHITCPGAKQIKEENKIYFSSVELAAAAGYSRAANCKY